MGGVESEHKEPGSSEEESEGWGERVVGRAREEDGEGRCECEHTSVTGERSVSCDPM